MKIFELIDGEVHISIGCLLYYEKEKSFIIELQDNLTEWTAPLLFAEAVKQNKYTVLRELSLLWVKERIIPSGRQNISSILINAKLSTYNEIDFLERSKGKCSQDSIFLRKLDYIPEFVSKRMQHNLTEFVFCGGVDFLCFFSDGTVRKISLDGLQEITGIEKIISNEQVLKSGHVAAGGYVATFNDSIDVPSSLLYNAGISIPLSINDFLCFVQNNIVDSSESCAMLECSRQNLAYLVSKNTLKPIKEDVKGNLYAKGNILASRE